MRTQRHQNMVDMVRLTLRVMVKEAVRVKVRDYLICGSVLSSTIGCCKIAVQTAENLSSRFVTVKQKVLTWSG